MFTHLMQVAKKLQTQPVLLFPEEEEMFKKVNTVFHKQELTEAVTNLQYKLYEDENYQNEDNENDGENELESFFSDTFDSFTDFFSDFNKPDLDVFDYKPSYYNYNDYNKPEPKPEPKINYNDNVDTYAKKYKDKYGNKIRKMDVHDLNNRINKHGNQAEQYWWNRNTNDNNNFDSQIFNSLIQNKTDIDLPEDDDKDEDIQKIFISGLKNLLTKKKEQEEEDEDDDDDDDKPQGQIQNKIVNFVDNNIANQIDDLGELLEDSTKYKEALQQCGTYNRFKDSNFQPNEYSIYGFGDRKDYSLQELRNLPWLRPDDFFKGEEFRVFDTIHCNDIEQGGLGDCYFLAAISAIAEYPQRLERLFLTKEYSQKGIYVVAMCINGIWQDIVLDDYVPCTKYSKKPAFNRSKSNELWVILLEKAWAKIHGGYMNIAAGLTREALRDLTGASAITYFTKRHREELWERLVQANFNKHIMTAGSDDLSNGSDALVEKIGIAGSHAYSLLEVYEFEIIDNGYKVLTPEESKEGMNIERVVKLRNPWGKGEWKGAWSDDSDLWTDELKEEIGFVNQLDGVFCMSWNDFLRYYSDVQICYYHDGYKYSALQLASPKNKKVIISFKLEMKGKYYLSLNQKNRRAFPKSKRYKYSNLSYIVAKLNDGKYNYVGGNMKADKENWIGKELDEGEYVVLIKTPWKSFVNEFSFSVYGPDRTEILQIPEFDLPKNFIQQVFLQHAKQDTENKLTKFTSQGHPDVAYKTYDTKGGFGYIYFENSEEGITLEATVELLGSVNIKICNPFTGLRPSIAIKSGEANIIPYESNALPYSAQMRMMTTFKSTGKRENLKEKVRQSPTVLTKSYQGQTLDIKVYVLYHQNGLAMLYQNNTDNYTVSEELEFIMENCHIDGAYGSYIEVLVGPGEERLLKVVKDNGANDFQAKIKKLFYTIK